MATRKNRKQSRKGSRKHSRKQRGGGLGSSYTFAAPIVPGVDNGPGAAPFSSCLETVRPGTVPMPTVNLGLPGLSKQSGGQCGVLPRRGRSQRGGRYGFDLSQPVGAGAPWAGGIPQVVKIPCESAGTTHNPLNPNLPTQSGGVGGVDSAFYAAPTAGYSNTPSTWVGSTGSPSLLQTPYEARTMNPACLKTGGGKRRRSRKASRKGVKKH